MSATIQREANDIYVLRLGGTVEKTEFESVQNTLSTDMNAGTKPRILAILDGFEGWERGADWGDLDFLFSHSNDIAKVAIVGDGQWQREAMAFAGAGFRNSPVKFFPASELSVAREWLV